jgi:hypothetical protein
MGTWRDAETRTISKLLNSEVLNSSGVKAVFKSAFSDGFGDILTDTRINLLVHHPTTPAVKSAGSGNGEKITNSASPKRPTIFLVK